jgi:cytochrome P450
MVKLTVQLETRWTLRSGSVGGEHYILPIRSHPIITRSGDRICPGQHLAHSTVTLTAASVLSTFDLLKKVDENGHEIEPKKEYSRGGVR